MPSPIIDDLDFLPRMPANRNVGIGCIGAGFIMADSHLVAYQKAGFNVVAIASKHPDHAQEVAKRHAIPKVYDHYNKLLQDPDVEVVDLAVPPDQQPAIICDVIKLGKRIRGILAQKPLACSFADAAEVVEICKRAGITLAVNQNMRYDHSIRACKCVLDRGYLGEPVLATIEMRAIPHWLPWHERLGFFTLRNMSIHHLDTFRFLFGDPARVYASVRTDPRMEEKFTHKDGICLYIAEYDNGFRAAAWDDVWTGPTGEGSNNDSYICWRVEGTEGVARGTIGWPSYPKHTPSTIDFMTKDRPGHWFKPRWTEAWFPDAFQGTMAQLLCALEERREPEISGLDNLKTMALVDACYRSAEGHRAVSLSEIMNAQKA